MKLVRYGPKGAEKPGLIDEAGVLRDLSAHVSDIDCDTCTNAQLDRLAALEPAALPQVAGSPRLGSPIKRPGHFIAIGLNFRDHAAEAGQPIPSEPVVFSKAPSSINGPHDDVVIPKGCTKLDWEVELAFVVSQRAWQISEADAFAHIAGYLICNDVSERTWQFGGSGQWTKGKSGPTFGPLGPYLVTTDEIPDPQNLDIFLDVNGTRRQTGNTSTMIFPIAEIIAYLSGIMVLEPGDVVTTGTPPGVGMGMNPPVFLQPGDVMTLGISGLGEQRQKVVAA
ncbi:FAA hydrolase family protein [Roseibium denhamense]|uniref:5-carboxymethyl-2-hydroxymuconate isomerase n=1 Tax=Roseibium denhamense TaxID=76305 RepID=A0ABY1N8P5_9HYPH|nr:fumarylacetoacetate hydrolase family protein [Roseibium denhamense]MTI05640.1 FAA hydrolase family protein [Roseibium denhamense]SMP03453.1 5-carboxymethyl-2-hydroxymuconate isomerase [Roseibium denhamense]